MSADVLEIHGAETLLPTTMKYRETSPNFPGGFETTMTFAYLDRDGFHLVSRLALTLEGVETVMFEVEEAEVGVAVDIDDWTDGFELVNHEEALRIEIEGRSDPVIESLMEGR